MELSENVVVLVYGFHDIRKQSRMNGQQTLYHFTSRKMLSQEGFLPYLCLKGDFIIEYIFNTMP